MNRPVALRRPSDRMELLTDDSSRQIESPEINYGYFPTIATPGTQSLVGDNRQLITRVVEGLPTNKSHPVQIEAVQALRDNDGVLLADPQGVIVGVDGVWVHRMLYADRVWDTRRLS